MSVVHVSDTPCASVSRYSVSNRKIIEVEIKLESAQEERDSSLVESESQQQIFIWVRNNINLPLGQGHGYTECEICKAYKRIIFDKSIYYEILGKFEVPKSTLTGSLNSIFPPLECSSLKHPWYLIGNENITKRIGKEVIMKIFVKNKSGNKTYLLKDKEVYIVSTSEIDVAHKLPIDIENFTKELQQVPMT